MEEDQKLNKDKDKGQNEDKRQSGDEDKGNRDEEEGNKDKEEPEDMNKDDDRAKGEVKQTTCIDERKEVGNLCISIFISIIVDYKLMK